MSTHNISSNEYPQNMFLLRNKKNISTFRLKKAPYIELIKILQKRMCNDLCTIMGKPALFRA